MAASEPLSLLALRLGEKGDEGVWYGLVGQAFIHLVGYMGNCLLFPFICAIHIGVCP